MATNSFDMSKLRRCSLQSVEEQLSSSEKFPENRFQCLYYNNEHKRYCEQSCKWFIVENPRLFKKAQVALELEQVSTVEFSEIIRTLFCGWHSSTRRFTSYQRHFEKIWERASQESRTKVLDAFRTCHKDIFEELWKEADMTMEERKQVRDLLNSFKEDTNDVTGKSPTSQRNSKDSGTSSQKYRRANDTKTEHIIDGGLLFTDTPTRSQTPQQHSQDQLDARPKLTPRSQSPSCSVVIKPASQRLATETAVFSNLTFVSGHKESIFDVIATRLRLNPPSRVQPAPLPAEKEKQILSNHNDLPYPGKKLFDLSSFSEVLPEYNANTSSESDTEAILELRTCFPAHELQTSGQTTPDWKHGIDKAKSGIKSLGSGRNIPSSFSFGWSTDDDASTRKDRSPSRPITDYRNPFEELGDIPSFSSLAISARPLTWTGKGLFGRIDADRSPSRLFSANPNPTEGLESLWNSIGPAISEPSLSDPGLEPFVLDERLRTIDPPSASRTSKALFSPFTRPVPPTSPSPAHGTNNFSDELRIEKPGRLTQDIRSLLFQPLVPALATVYVLKAPNYFKDKAPCVKIGMTKNVTQRIINLSTTCGITDLSECQESDAVAIPRELAARVEKLCHMELSPFRRIMKCERGGNSAKHTVSHEEWFAVPEQVAVQTVKRWLKFIELMPYHEQGKYSEISRIRDDWQKVIKELQVEKLADWGIRHKDFSSIYDKWIEDAAGKVLPR